MGTFVENVNSLATNLTTENITAVNTVNGNITNVNTVAGLSAGINDLAARTAAIDSLYADKATLDSLFADKAKLDSLFADKAKLDSLYADKVTLDSLYADKTELDAIYLNLAEILDADNNAAIATGKAIEASASATLAQEYAESIVPSSFVKNVDTIADLATINPTTIGVDNVFVKDLDRGGLFVWSSTGTANGGTVFEGLTGYWVRQYSGAVNVKWFGAKGDGIADDTVALQNALSQCGSSGCECFLPDGTYNIFQKLSISSPSKGFKLVGESISNTIFKRFSSLCSTVIEAVYADGAIFENFTIDGGYAEYPTYPVGDNIGHGIAVGNTNNSTIRNIKVINYRDLGIYCGHSNLTVGQSPIYGDNLIENCFTDGNSTANNGIAFVSMKNSRIDKCTVRNLKLDGVPAYGIQLKNACHYCSITNSSVFSSRGGFVIGQEAGEGGHIAGLHAKLSNLYAENCVLPVYIGDTQFSNWNNITSVQTAGAGATMQSGVYVSANSFGNNFDNVYVLGLVGAATLASARPAAYFESGSATYYPRDNRVTIKSVNSTGTIIKLAHFLEFAARNIVDIVDCTSHTIGYPSSYVQDLSTADKANVVVNNGRVCTVHRTIASDAITLGSKYITNVIIETEALTATDNIATITGGYHGQRVLFQTTANARDVTFVTTGNITLNGNVSFTASTINCSIELLYNSITAKWCEISRSTNN